MSGSLLSLYCRFIADCASERTLTETLRLTFLVHSVYACVCIISSDELGFNVNWVFGPERWVPKSHSVTYLLLLLSIL